VQMRSCRNQYLVKQLLYNESSSDSYVRTYQVQYQVAILQLPRKRSCKHELEQEIKVKVHGQVKLQSTVHYSLPSMAVRAQECAEGIVK
jgi:hypothetical protein